MIWGCHVLAKAVILDWSHPPSTLVRRSSIDKEHVLCCEAVCVADTIARLLG